MKKIACTLFAYFLLTTSIVVAQPYASWTSTELRLNNGVVQRTIKLPANAGNFVTTSYKPVQGEFNYLATVNDDFRFEANGTMYTGKTAWTLVGINNISDNNQGNGAGVTLRSQDKKIEVVVNFLLYPGLPVVRKSLVVKNLSKQAIALESVDVEIFQTSGYFANTFTWVCSDYGRRRSLGPYKGDAQDALVVLHNMDWASGIVIGNEATGVLKRTSAFWDAAEICTGLTHKDDRFPFRKWIKPNQSFETPQVFTMVYNNHKDPEGILNTTVPDFVRKHMGIRLSQLKEKPTFVYNTWEPFKSNIDEKLVMQLAKTAAETGMKEFVIDDGWQDNLGDWGINKTRFPNGLKPVFDYIKSLGMKPGLWISVGSASDKSKIYNEHPEWFTRDKKGNFSNLHSQEPGEAKIRSACFSTGWKDYIKNILLKLTLEYGLEYMKLDFSVVSSAYIFDPKHSGCYAKNHPLHKDHHESMFTNYEQMWKLFDELHAAKPDLFIDCTFEAMGGLQLIDYAMLKHAEGNWLSNYAGNAGSNTDLRVRNMAWWRSPAMPATALVIGNPEMQDTGWALHIKSLAGALPIMLGDPRKLSPADFKQYRAYADWLQAMENRHQIMSYRQDLPGFGEPLEGAWDGFQRINTETKSGGILGVFRHGSPETGRRVTVKYLDPDKRYQIKNLDGKIIATGTGNDLQQAGFEVELTKMYDGDLFEVSERE